MSTAPRERGKNMKIAICGYGGLGRGVECAVRQNADTELFGVFTRRDPESIKTFTGAPVYSVNDILKFKGAFDVLIICTGSAKDLPLMTPRLAEHFEVVDSFDTHKRIPEHFQKVDAAAKKGDHAALISAGWDPGLFSIERLYSSALLPDGESYTFWGRGVSQGHTEAIRRIDGVLDARQYTVPVPEAAARVREQATERRTLTAKEMHRRECYVVARDGADKALIEERIRSMPDYFEGYETSVTFIDENEMKEKHTSFAHGGSVIRAGRTGAKGENISTVEYRLRLDSNPEFTANALVAFGRALLRMKQRGCRGCFTVLDIAPIDVLALPREQILRSIL